MSRLDDIEAMAQEWHEASDHARDGAPYGSPICNCENVAWRAYALGWRKTDD
jgi:hypothetical protein